MSRYAKKTTINSKNNRQKQARDWFALFWKLTNEKHVGAANILFAHTRVLLLSGRVQDVKEAILWACGLIKNKANAAFTAAAAAAAAERGLCAVVVSVCNWHVQDYIWAKQNARHHPGLTRRRKWEGPMPCAALPWLCGHPLQ